MALRDGDRVRLSGANVVAEYVCRLPPPLVAAAPAAPPPLPQRPLEPVPLPASSEAQARELAALAAREAQLVGELTSGLQGGEKRAAQRNLKAAHEALVGVAL
eukprot:7376027-Prymnesium_polylepis.1